MILFYLLYCVLWAVKHYVWEILRNLCPSLSHQLVNLYKIAKTKEFEFRY